MKSLGKKWLIQACAVAAGLAVLAGCATKPEPPPPAPPPVVTIPPRPAPPMGAAPNLTIPPRNALGIRETVNTGLSPHQAIWNLRSAYNVAALNCQKPEHAAILAGYGAFLKNHSKVLSQTNRSLDRDFREQHGSQFIRERESYQTQVYNYFALPPVMPAFCDAILALTTDLMAVQPGELEDFAPQGLARIDAVYRDFFNSYDQYRTDLAAWTAQYMPSPVVLEVAPYQASVQLPQAQPALQLPAEAGRDQ